MDIIRETFDLLVVNKHPTRSSTDIHEHLTTLCNYAKECDSVFETGVRGCISSWAFLYGLLNGREGAGPPRKKTLFMNDIDVCDISALVSAGRSFPEVELKSDWKSNLLLDFDRNYDIVFIDTWHVYGQLKRELEKFAKFANKYIIMHDTTVDEIHGETIRCNQNAHEQSRLSGIPMEEIMRGLWPAVEEFLQNHPEWYIKERYTNNNGLTVLAKKTHPIQFSIPSEKIVAAVPEKTKLLAHIVPGISSTYIYDNETDYYADYRRSWFALTKKKGGWDCLRHYEILANGCIPLFENIDACPRTIMELFPKELAKQGQQLYSTMVGQTELSPEQTQQCKDLATKMLEHTRKYLTTEAMARSVLLTAKMTDAQRVLYLSGDASPDYLRCLTLHGLKTIFGTDCHDYPKIEHIYKTSTDYRRLYGKGITYTNLLESQLHDDARDQTVLSDIQNRQYDVIIYGSYHRGMPYYDEVMKVYEADRVILFCGEDDHVCDYSKWTKKGHHVFVRELIV
jgi:hypothetical protein